MNIKPIRNDDDLQNAFRHLEGIFQAEKGTPEADEMEVLVTLIEAYENITPLLRQIPLKPSNSEWSNRD